MNQRYIRQTLLAEIGEVGQSKLLKSRVAIVGCGGLGSIVAPYLAGAGVGNLLLIDADKPHVSNLHRQVFFGKIDSDRTKSEALAEHIQKLNPEINVELSREMLSKQNIERLFKDYELVVECTDDMMCKYLVNDYCAINNIPLVYGAIHKFEGYVSVFRNETLNDIHLRDIFPEPQLDIPSCSEVGVLSTIAGLIGLMQANEVIKYILGIGESLIGKLLRYNALDNEQYKMKLKKTFSENLVERYHSNNYYTLSWAGQLEITAEQLQNERALFQLVSILEYHEQKDIDEDVAHMPLSNYDLEDYNKIRTPAVFYCQTGKRSLGLVSRILAEDPEAEVYSLKGGVKAFFNQN